MTAVTQEAVDRLRDELSDVWTTLGDLVRGQAGLKGGLTRLEGDVVTLKADVATLKADVVTIKQTMATKADLADLAEQMRSSQRATDRRFDRLEASIERLTGMVVRDEQKGALPAAT